MRTAKDTPISFFFFLFSETDTPLARLLGLVGMSVGFSETKLYCLYHLLSVGTLNLMSGSPTILKMKESERKEPLCELMAKCCWTSAGVGRAWVLRISSSLSACC